MNYKLENKKCDICGSENFKVLHETIMDGATTKMLIGDDGKPFHNVDVMCMDCGLVFKNPSFTREELSRFYNEDYSESFRPGWNKTISKSSLLYSLTIAIMAIDWLKDRMPLTGKRVVDIGSGDGVFARVMQSEGATVDAIDIDPRACEIARKLHGINTKKIDFMSTTEHEKYDIVCMRNSLEHFYSPKEVLALAKEWMTDDGIILIEAPSAAYPYPGIPVGAFLSAAHNYTFLPETIGLLADKCGLGVRDLAYAGHHSCMLIILDRNQSKETFINQAEDIYALLKERYTEHDNTFFQLGEISLKLLNNTNVYNTVEEIKKYKHTSNRIVYQLLTMLQPTKEGLRKMSAILDNYNWNINQASDVNCCSASYEFFKGVFYREMGDFTKCMEQLKKAKFLFPKFLEKNVVKEMVLDGILSEQTFAEQIWYGVEKMIKQYE